MAALVRPSATQREHLELSGGELPGRLAGVARGRGGMPVSPAARIRDPQPVGGRGGSERSKVVNASRCDASSSSARHSACS